MDHALTLEQAKTLFLSLGSGYVEGTWTPEMYGGTSAGTTTHSIQVGAYTRIGRVVTATANVSWTNATGTGDLRISLPFTAANVTNQRYAVAIRTSELTFTATSGLQGLIVPNTNYLLIGGHTTNGVNASLAVETAGSVVFTATYFVK